MKEIKKMKEMKEIRESILYRRASISLIFVSGARQVASRRATLKHTNAQSRGRCRLEQGATQSLA